MVSQRLTTALALSSKVGASLGYTTLELRTHGQGAVELILTPQLPVHVLL